MSVRDLSFFSRDQNATPEPRFHEHDRVWLREPVIASGRVLPEGSSGTIVSVWERDRAFEVEFTTPFSALVTLQRHQVAPALPVGR